MTLHEPQVEISTIKMTRTLSDGRHRFRDADKKTVADIQQSMSQFGQLQPLILDNDGELVDGLHRLTAAMVLGWRTVWAVRRDQMDEYTARCIELEVNIKRKEVSWQEQAYSLSELHKLRKAVDPNWSQDMTAQIAGPGQHQARVAESIMLTQMMELFPEIGEAKSRNQALSWAKAKAAAIVRVKEVKDAPEAYAAVEDRIILGDSVEVIRAIPDGSFHLVLTDPPFGINYDDRKAGTESSLTTYQDDEESYHRLLGMAPDLYRVIKNNGWLVWFLGPTWYERAKVVFREAGFTVDEIPVIWDRSDGRTFTTRPDRYFARAYDMALHCIKGDPQVVQRGKPNIIRVPPVSVDERSLTVERPVELYAEIIRRLTVEGETVVDFFTGSGSVLAAAASLRRQYFGVELDPERRAVAIKKVKAHTPEAK
jgi:adenine-specific DNA-methyltransferase